ncbi:hypothetical protein CC1G_13592 [Coprinopsis cinerea okayama7|uniref:Mediator of RNA polymerase II transcription subunit 9 n=1 Tax=Coprinopsis cinerea (strain Okayama-7 / 130 / ATCC MYA-4618 / FGSC 9003) TaxID=240176 RepID=D6RJT9_COPC7|nr:hypothetical protein CC1G_13592 [Coprinopsis cinerea okayama7\|eukprot:XP_002912059.1 hypothetical protein CC1G_13592 [Coprinopsis cinerea okayama7\
MSRTWVLRLRGYLMASGATDFAMSNTVSSALYESLILKLVTVLEITRESEGITTPQAKQKLLQATNDFKNSLAQAKEIARNIPGGEFTVEEQDEVIEMLETLRDRKRLAHFSSKNLASAHSLADTKMEIDSMASTPFGG